MKVLNKNLMLEAAIFLILSISFINILGEKYVTPDDISVVMQLHGNLHYGALNHATSSGRVWVYVADIYGYIVESNRNSDIIKYIIGIITTYLIYKTIEIIENKNVANVWIIIYLAILPIGWWYNILNAYLGIYFGIGLGCLSVIIFDKFKFLSYLIFILSIINYETITIISFIIILIYQIKYSKSNKEILNNIIPFIILLMLYSAIYTLWKYKNYVQYDGFLVAKLSALDIVKYIGLMISSATTAMALNQKSSLIFYSEIYKFQFNMGSFGISEMLNFYCEDLKNILAPIIFAYASNILLKENNINYQRQKCIFSIFIIFLTLIPILSPFVFSNKYQLWFLREGVQGYTFSIIITIFIALILSLATSRVNRKIILIITTLLFSFSFYVNSETNKNIVMDNLRWESINRVFNFDRIKSFLIVSGEVYAPILWSHSWWLGFHDEFKDTYWMDYTDKFYKKINFTKQGSNSKIEVFDVYGDNIFLYYKYSRINATLTDLTIIHPKKDQIFLMDADFNDKLIVGQDKCLNNICETYFSQKVNADVEIVSSNKVYSIKIR